MGFPIGISNDIRHNDMANIHGKYNTTSGLGVFSLTRECMNHFSIKYYDAKTGGYLDSVSYNKSRNR